MRRAHMTLVIGALAVAVLGSCGGDDDTTDTTAAPDTTVPATTVPPDTTAVPDTTVPATTLPPTTVPPTTVPPTTVPYTTPPTVPTGPDQPVVFPAPDAEGFTTPEAAAEGFLALVFDPGPTVGPFMAGDSRSGEFEVFATNETGDPIGNPRSVLLVRQFGADGRWWVTAAISDNAAFDAPAHGDTVAAGPLAVSGVARGFEANVNVSARLIGDGDVLDEEITMGGSMETPEPYEVELDLSGTTPGDVAVLLVRGGVGLETDPGDFSAISVTIGS